jgi:hypothetical protein
MTVEMKFENNEQLKLFASIVDKGLEAYKNENCETCLRMNSEEYSNNMKVVEDIELAMIPIKQKIKYIEDYNRYLELKKIFEPMVEI